MVTVRGSIFEFMDLNAMKKVKEERSSSSDGGAYYYREAYPSVETFELHHKTSSDAVVDRKEQTVVVDLEGSLIRSKWPFPYYMLVAISAGSLMRAFILLLLSPWIRLLHATVSESLAIQLLIFVSTAGLKATKIQSVGRAVLCRFYLEDLHRHAMKAVLACGKRWVVTATPREMAEPFLKEYLGAEKVIATELQTMRGVCTGLVRRRGGSNSNSNSPVPGGGVGLMWGAKKRGEAVMEAARIGSDENDGTNVEIDVGIANEVGDETGFLSMCKERYMVRKKKKQNAASAAADDDDDAVVRKDEYPKPLIFHDGRLVQRPTELVSLFLFLWLPIGLALAFARMLAWIVLPRTAALPALALLGIRLRVKGAPPPPDAAESGGRRLYICTHKIVVDGMMCSIAVRKKLAAAIYSVSPWVEAFTPMTSVRLLRDRSLDSFRLRRVLQHHDLFLCPEGTTCREPFLLRFSPLFAELSNRIVPVGIDVRQSLFYGNTASGNKLLDPTFFFMNPSPLYFLHVLDPVPEHMTCAGGKTPLEVANAMQELLGRAMGFRCTQLTRKHKYLLLAGNDGVDQKRQKKNEKEKT